LMNSSTSPVTSVVGLFRSSFDPFVIVRGVLAFAFAFAGAGRFVALGFELAFVVALFAVRDAAFFVLLAVFAFFELAPAFLVPWRFVFLVVFAGMIAPTGGVPVEAIGIHGRHA